MDEHTLRIWAQELGFAQAALCDAHVFEAQRQIVLRQAPLRERKQLRFDPERDDPQAKSLAVLLWPYAPAANPGGERLFVDSYYFASNAAYHAARALEQRLTEAGCFARANVPYPAREAAVRAGMGLIGHSGMLITQQFGTRVVIVLMATDIPRTGEAMARPEQACLRCGRCAAACPSGAIDEGGMRHPERCMRNFMMEGVTAPEPLRGKMGMRLIGCDICQRVCPMQPRLPEQRDEGFSLCDFVTADEAAFSQSVSRLAERIGRNAARPQRVRAQAALLAGNSGNPSYLPVLSVWARSEFEAVRSHAAWAIERLQRGDLEAPGLDRSGKTG